MGGQIGHWMDRVSSGLSTQTVCGLYACLPPDSKLIARIICMQWAADVTMALKK